MVPARDAAAKVAEVLTRGEPVSDAAFDELFPSAVRQASVVCWTPVEVVREVVRLIRPTESTRLLDIGSGPGKFCSIAALLAPGSYTGIERSPELHQVAVETRRRLGAERATLLLGDALDLDWGNYDVLYFFNPFQEFLARSLVDAMGLSVAPVEDWARCARATHMRLHQLAPGTRVVLLNGYGMDLPVGYEQIAVGRGTALAVWQKAAG